MNFVNKVGKVAGAIFCIIMTVIAVRGVVKCYFPDPYTGNPKALLPIHILLIVVFAVFPLYLWLKDRYYKNEDNWVYTNARLTGEVEEYDGPGSVRSGAKYSEYTDHQIEYSVDGKKYIKYIKNCSPEDEERGTVRIKYLKKRPSYFFEV